MADFLTTFERYIRKSQHLFRYETDFHKTDFHRSYPEQNSQNVAK